MKEIASPKEYQKARNRYGILASMPIVVALIPLFATVFFQITLNYTPQNGYTNLYAISLLFSVSSFTTILASPSHDLNLLHSLPSLLAALIAIVMILCSSYAVKGKKKFLLVSLLTYGIDTLFSIPVIVLSVMKIYEISFHAVDITLNLLIHALSLFLLLWGIVVGKRCDIYEAKMQIAENSIHTENKR